MWHPWLRCKRTSCIVRVLQCCPSNALSAAAIYVVEPCTGRAMTLTTQCAHLLQWEPFADIYTGMLLHCGSRASYQASLGMCLLGQTTSKPMKAMKSFQVVMCVKQRMYWCFDMGTLLSTEALQWKQSLFYWVYQSTLDLNGRPT